MSIFGDRLYLELQDNGMDEQRKVNEGLVALAEHYNLPLVATNDCHYLRKQEARAHELLLCIQTGKKITDKDRLKLSTRPVLFQVARGDGIGLFQLSRGPRQYAAR